MNDLDSFQLSVNCFIKHQTEVCARNKPCVETLKTSYIEAVRGKNPRYPENSPSSR